VPAGVATEEGLTDRAKPVSGAVIVSCTVSEWLNVPLVALMVSVKEPTGVVAVVTTVSTLVVSRFGFGAKVAVVPAGRPDTDSVTGLLKPLLPLTLTT
jgi:hypothetical protein